MVYRSDGIRTSPFITTRVSFEADQHISDLEAAYARLLSCPPAGTAAANAYAALCYRRKELYEYIERLEHYIGIPRTTIKRFE